jgi:hypothetical protein
MQITLQMLENWDACEDGIDWFNEQYTDGTIEFDILVKDLKDDTKYSYLNWLVTKLLTGDNCIRYAIYAAESVLYIFEDKYPDDLRPRKAIEAAKEYLNTKTNAAAAKAAADAAYAAANAAYAAANAAYAAYAAAYAANAAAYAAYAAAAYAAANVANAAAYAAYAAAAYAAANAGTDAAAFIDYGLGLLKEQDK